MNTRFGFAALIFVLLGASVASAADIGKPVYKAPPPAAEPFNWTGFYIGANAGWAWSRADVATTTCDSIPTTCYFRGGVSVPPSFAGGELAFNAVRAAGLGAAKDNFFNGGVQAGYNWQIGHFVLGAEADINSFRSNASHVGVTQAYSSIAVLGPRVGMRLTDNVSTDWLATVRARLGYTTGNLLLYVTGGAAFSKVNHAYSDGEFGFGPNPPCGGRTAGENYCSSGNDQLKTGWTLGGGGEWALNRNWTVKAEYLYVNLGNTYSEAPLLNGNGTAQVTTGGVGQVTKHTFDFTSQIARVGINYKFDWGKAPVVAKY